MPVAEKVTVELELKDQEYTAKLRANEREFKRTMDATERAAAEAARDIERTLGQVPDSLRRQYRELGADIGTSLAGASRAAQLASVAIVGFSLNAARRAEDINDAFAFTFSEIGSDADAAAERIASSFNRTTTSVKENLNNAFQILTGLGLDSARSFDAAQQLAERSIDLASQKGITDARAYEAIISGLTGETEPLKRLGVVLSEATVQAELLRLGFQGNASDATEAQKAVARLNIILDKTSSAQGDVARTADSANNKLKEAQTEFENAAIALGQELLPALVTVAGAATDVLRAFNDLPGGVQVAGLAFLGLIAVGGPIAGLIANLGRVITLANETRIALAGIAAGGAAGSAAGAAGAGGAAGLLARFAPTAALGSGLLTGLGSFAPTPDRNLANLESQLAFARENQPERRDYIRSLENEIASQRRINALTTGLNDLATGTGDFAGAVDTSVVGGFGLGGLSNGPGGGAGGRGGAAAASQAAQELIRLRSDLARVQRDQLTDAERAAFELAETISIIERAARGGVITSREAAILTGGAAAIDLDRGDPVELRSLGSENRDIARQLREGDDALREQYRERGQEIAASFIEVLRSGNIGQEIGLRFADAAFNSLEQALTGLFASLLQNGGQGGNIVSSIGSFFGFGGGRAIGGPVRRGFAYDVGESGRERFVAPADGYIIPNVNAQARIASPTRIEVRQTFSLEGATGDAAIYGNVARMIAQGQRQTLSIVKTQAPNVQTEQRLLRD